MSTVVEDAAALVAWLATLPWGIGVDFAILGTGLLLLLAPEGTAERFWAKVRRGRGQLGRRQATALSAPGSRSPRRTRTEFLVHGIERRPDGAMVRGQANLPSGAGHGFSTKLAMPEDQQYLPKGRTLSSLSDEELVEAAWKKCLATGYYDYL